MSTKCVLNLHHSTSLRGNYADIATLGFFEEKFQRLVRQQSGSSVKWK